MSPMKNPALEEVEEIQTIKDSTIKDNSKLRR